MRTAIDVLFLDREGRAVRAVQGLRPWRAVRAPGAWWCVELPTGTLARRGVAPGERGARRDLRFEVRPGG